MEVTLEEITGGTRKQAVASGRELPAPGHSPPLSASLSCTWRWPSSPWSWSPAALATTRSLRAPTSSPASRTSSPRWVPSPQPLAFSLAPPIRPSWPLIPCPQLYPQVLTSPRFHLPTFPLHAATSTPAPWPPQLWCSGPTASNCHPRRGQVSDQCRSAGGGRPGGDERRGSSAGRHPNPPGPGMQGGQLLTDWRV